MNLGEIAIGPGASKAYPWSLKIGCSPHPYVVLGASGSILYSENLQAKTAEAAQFCEGYAEP